MLYLFKIKKINIINATLARLRNKEYISQLVKKLGG